ncbi:MAG: DUF481 domain-containing protein [Gammaproteobacteria bacterium]
MRYLLLFAAISLCAIADASQRTFELTNGDRLTGLVLERTDDEVVLRHALLGDIRLPVTQIANEIEQIEASDEQGLTAPTDVEGTDLAERQDDDSATSGDRATPEKPATPEDPVTREPEPPGLFGSGLLIGWQHRAAAGIAGSAGNSEVLHFTAGLSSKFEDQHTRRFFDSGAFISQTDGATSKKKAFVEFTNDWLQPDSPWFFFAYGRYDYDRFEDWRHRLAAQFGPGYEFFRDEESYELRARASGGLTRTFGVEDELTPELALGLEGEWHIASNQKLFGSMSFLPNLRDLNEFRALSSAGWLIDLTPSGKLHLEFGVQNEYDSDPGGDSRKNDFDYYSRLGYEF